MNLTEIRYVNRNRFMRELQDKFKVNEVDYESLVSYVVDPEPRKKPVD
jgi:hypothetical protein